MEWWKELYEKLFYSNKTWSIPTQKRLEGQIHYFLQSTSLTSGYVLDLGAGTGSHIKCLEKNGFNVKGIEYSQAIVDEGLKGSPNLPLYQGNMNDLEEENTYDAITFFDTSFGLFDDQTNESLLHKVYKALKSGAWLAIDYLNPDYWSLKKEEMTIRNYKEPGDLLVRQYVYDSTKERIFDKKTYISSDHTEEKFPDQILAVYKKETMRKILQNAGFQNIHFYGSHAYEYSNELLPLSSKSAFTFVVGQKQS